MRRGVSSLKHAEVKVTETLFSNNVGQLGMLEFSVKFGVLNCVVVSAWKEVIQLAIDHIQKACRQ